MSSTLVAPAVFLSTLLHISANRPNSHPSYADGRSPSATFKSAARGARKSLESFVRFCKRFTVLCSRYGALRQRLYDVRTYYFDSRAPDGAILLGCNRGGQMVLVSPNCAIGIRRRTPITASLHARWRTPPPRGRFAGPVRPACAEPRRLAALLYSTVSDAYRTTGKMRLDVSSC